MRTDRLTSDDSDDDLLVDSMLILVEEGAPPAPETTSRVIPFPAPSPEKRQDSPLPAPLQRQGRPMAGAEMEAYKFFRRLLSSGLSQMLIGAVLFDRPNFLKGMTVHDALDSATMRKVLFENEFRYLTGTWAERSAEADHQMKRESSTA